MAYGLRPESDAEQSYRRNFVILAVDSASFSFLKDFLSPWMMLPLFLSRVALSPHMVGVLPVIMTLGFYSMQVVLMNRISLLERKKRLLFMLNVIQRIAVIGFCLVAWFSYSLSRSWVAWLFLATYGVYCVAGGLLTPAWAHVVSTCIYRKRGLFMSIARLIAGLFTATLGVYLSTQLVTCEPPDNFVRAFIGLALFGIVTLPFAGLFKEVSIATSATQNGSPPAGNLLSHVSMVLADLQFRRYLMVRCVQSLAEIGYPFVSVYAINKFPHLMSCVGDLNVVFMFSQVAGSFLGGMLGDRLGYKKVLMLSSVTGVLAMLAVSVGTSSLMVPVVLSLLGIAVSTSITGTVNITMEYSPEGCTPFYFGVSNLLISPMLIGVPLLGSLLTIRGSFLTVFLVGLIVHPIAYSLLRTLEDPRTEGAQVLQHCLDD